MPLGFHAPRLSGESGVRQRPRLTSFALLCLLWTGVVNAAEVVGYHEVISLKGRVEILRAGSLGWEPARPGDRLHPGDHLRTGERSKVQFLIPSSRLSRGPTEPEIERSLAEMPERSEVRIERRDELPILEVLRRMIRFFHRGPAREIEIRGGIASASVLGTEFMFELASDGTVVLGVYDGSVLLSNDAGEAKLSSGQVGRATPGHPPRPETAVWMPDDFGRIQWALYYPAILDFGDLGWSEAPDPALRESFAAYRTGNLPSALADYPAGRVPPTPQERIFLAALLLSVGNVEEAETLLVPAPDDPRLGRLVDAHRQLIAAVHGRSRHTPESAIDLLPMNRDSRTFETRGGHSPSPSEAKRRWGRAGMRADHHSSLSLDSRPEHASRDPSSLSTELLADSYYLQSRHQLALALAAARRATDIAPASGFAWARRAELEFGFGRTREAAGMVEQALRLTPENVAARALRGFLHAAHHRSREAELDFEEAIRLDGGLGNAWLGRGLCRIRRGDLAAGRQDLLVAAAIEPQRSFLRSYLAKAFADSQPFGMPARDDLALHEFGLARRLDPLDPTPWLYQSLLDREANRLNDSVHDLDRALALAENRALYRSEPLLDQDRAVAFANQAIAYRDAGMLDVGIQTAQRAVAMDPSNPVAHHFLAESYANAGIANLRYETPRLSEYLVANLMAPVGAGLFSPSLSQQEYSRLFERDGLGAFSRTLYLSRGAWSQNGGARGTFGGTGFLAEGFFETDPGYAPNNDFERRGFGAQWKQQVGTRDSLYLQTFAAESDSGDAVLRYDPHDADPDLRYEERLAPAVLAGWHRTWSSDQHTLFLAGWIENDQTYHDLQPGLGLPIVRKEYRSDFDLFSVELQHLWTADEHHVVAGARWQTGNFDLGNRGVHPVDATLDYEQQLEASFDRVQLYAYDTWQILEPLHLTAGISYDDVRYPLNHRYGWLDDGEDRRNQVSPKAGAVWEALPRTWLRTAYTRSLAGISYDQSVRLEPTQVAGFNQAFRSLMSESVTGASSVPEFETFAVAVEARLTTNTWFSVSGEILASEVVRSWGRAPGPFLPAVQMPQELDYEEQALQTTLNQFLGDGWSVGARYRLSAVELHNRDSELLHIPPGPIADQRAVFHHLALSAYFNHPSGFFAAGEAVWMHQDDAGTRDEFVRSSWDRSEDLWQFNLWGGWRFFRRRAELLLGVINLGDQDYRLHPLSLDSAPERERAFIGRLSLSF